MPPSRQKIDEHYISSYSIPFIQFEQIYSLNEFKGFDITLAYRPDIKIAVSFKFVYPSDDDYFY